MKLAEIARTHNVPVQTVEIKDTTGKSRTYNATTYKTKGKANQSVATFKKLVRKVRSDKGKERAPYNRVKKFDPNEKLKKEIKEVNKKLLKAQKDLAQNQSNRGRKRDVTLTSKPAALQAVENWADSEKNSKYFVYTKQGGKTNKHWYVQFDDKILDEIEKTIANPESSKEDISKAKEAKRKLKEMIEGNNASDVDAKRVGMLNAKSLTKEGRESLHEDAYETFVNKYKAEIGPAGMTKEEYIATWKLYDELKKEAEAAEAEAYFYGILQQGIKDGVLQMDYSDFEKWLVAQLETAKQEAQLHTIKKG